MQKLDLNLKTAAALIDVEAKNSHTIKQLIQEHRAVTTDTGLMGPGYKGDEIVEEVEEKPCQIVAKYEKLIKERKDKRKIPRIQRSKKLLNGSNTVQDIESVEQLFLR